MDRKGERKIEEEKEHRENEFAEQCAGILSNNYGTSSFHCVSWEAESSHSQFQFIFIEAIVSILVGRKRGEAERGRERDGKWDRGKYLGRGDRKA